MKQKKVMGRPEILDEKKLETLEALLGIYFIEIEQIASILKCHRETVLNYIKKLYGKTFNEIKHEKVKALNARLAATQWKTALSGSVPMQIFLGKQYLGQADKIENKNEIKNDVTFKIGWEDADSDTDNQTSATEKNAPSETNS